MPRSFGGFVRDQSLVEFAGMDQGLPAEEFVLLLPFSKDGRAFAERFSRGWTSAGDLLGRRA